MATRNSRLVIEDNGDITRVNFVDRNILEEAAIAQIGEEISQVIDNAAPPKVLISFENVEHLSSAALGTLITINNKIRAKGGQLRLSNIDKNIYEVFVITKLNKLFQIHDDVSSALASFK